MPTSGHGTMTRRCPGGVSRRRAGECDWRAARGRWACSAAELSAHISGGLHRRVAQFRHQQLGHDGGSPHRRRPGGHRRVHGRPRHRYSACVRPSPRTTGGSRRPSQCRVAGPRTRLAPGCDHRRHRSRCSPRRRRPAPGPARCAAPAAAAVCSAWRRRNCTAANPAPVAARRGPSVLETPDRVRGRAGSTGHGPGGGGAMSTASRIRWPRSGRPVLRDLAGRRSRADVARAIELPKQLPLAKPSASAPRCSWTGCRRCDRNGASPRRRRAGQPQSPAASAALSRE